MEVILTGLSDAFTLGNILYLILGITAGIIVDATHGIVNEIDSMSFWTIS
jgi:TctA family transporter